MATLNELSASIDSLCESVDKAVAEREQLRSRTTELEIALRVIADWDASSPMAVESIRRYARLFTDRGAA